MSHEYRNFSLEKGQRMIVIKYSYDSRRHYLYLIESFAEVEASGQSFATRAEALDEGKRFLDEANILDVLNKLKKEELINLVRLGIMQFDSYKMDSFRSGEIDRLRQDAFINALKKAGVNVNDYENPHSVILKYRGITEPLSKCLKDFLIATNNTEINTVKKLKKFMLRSDSEPLFIRKIGKKRFQQIHSIVFKEEKEINEGSHKEFLDKAIFESGIGMGLRELGWTYKEIAFYLGNSSLETIRMKCIRAQNHFKRGNKYRRFDVLKSGLDYALWTFK